MRFVDKSPSRTSLQIKYSTKGQPSLCSINSLDTFLLMRIPKEGIRLFELAHPYPTPPREFPCHRKTREEVTKYGIETLARKGLVETSEDRKYFVSEFARSTLYTFEQKEVQSQTAR